MSHPATDGTLLGRTLRVARTRGVAGVLHGAGRRVVARVRPRRRPRTLPSRAATEMLRRRDPRPPLHVLHIGKTGGTALKYTLLEHADASRHRLLLHGHDVTLAHVPHGEQFMFILRDPISRFVSAFNGRQREDRPRYHYPWTREERLAFAVFGTPDALASALTSTDPSERARAERAMRGIGHVNTPYGHWFGDLRSFRGRLSDVFFIAFQDQLDTDFELLRRRLGLPRALRLPSDAVAAHRSLGIDDHLGEKARENLTAWYADDVAFVDFCRELAPLVNPETPRASRTEHRQSGEAHRPARRPVPVLLAPLGGIAAFASAAVVVEGSTDRDWSLSGLEWPADFVTAAVLVALVPLAHTAVRTLARIVRGNAASARVHDHAT